MRIAIFMIVLILTLPFASATLSVQEFRGSDNVENVVKGDDQLTIKVLASLPSDPVISASQVRVTKSGAQFLFDSCVAQSDALYQCSYTENIRFARQDIDYSIELFTDGGQLRDSITKKLSVDYLGAVIKSLRVSPLTTIDGKVTIAYVAEDYASVAGETSSCSGVDRIDFYDGGINGKLIKSVVSDLSCQVSSEITHTFSGQGGKQVCALAYDRFNNTDGVSCSSFTVDTTAPEPKEISFVDQDGVVLNFFPQHGVVADVSIKLEDAVPSSVSADFSKLSSAGVRAPSSDDDGVFTWENINVDQFSSCQIGIVAKDSAGNVLNKQVSCSTVVDNTPPEFISLSTGIVNADNKMVIGKDSVITAVIREEGSGFVQQRAFLDLRTIGLGTAVPATNCTKGVDWECAWKVAPLKTGTVVIGASTQTKDDIGNSIAAPPFSVSAVADVSNPLVLGFEDIRVIPGEFEHGDFILTGDSLEFKIKAKDFTVGVANFSSVGGDVQECVAAAETDVCSFSSMITSSGPKWTTIPFTFYDLAGNRKTVSYSFLLYGILDDANPNYWDVTSVSCSPSLIDKGITEIKDVKVYCHAKISGSGAETAIISFEGIESCTGDLAGKINSVEVLNTHPNSTDPYLGLTLEVAEFKGNSLTGTCPINIFSTIGSGKQKSFTQYPEVENVTFTLNFFDNPAGTLNHNIEKKLDDAIDEAEELGDWIGVTRQIFKYVEKMCQVRQILWNIVEAWEIVTDALGAIVDILGVSIVGGAQAKQVDSVHQVICNTQDVGMIKSIAGPINNILQPFCDFANCQAGPSDWKKQNLLQWVGSAGGGGLLGQNSAGTGVPDTSAQGNPVGDPWNNPSAIEKTYDEQGLQGKPIWNVKESLVLSAATFCIPGIIYNVDKYRQIQCKYAVCLGRDVREDGFPISHCDDEKAYMTCNFVVNQVFNAIPYTNIVNHYISQVKEIIANPAAAIAALVGLPCKDLCTAPPGSKWLREACSATKVLAAVGQVVEDMQSIENFKDTFEVNDEWCEELEDVKDDIKKDRTEKVTG